MNKISMILFCFLFLLMMNAITKCHAMKDSEEIDADTQSIVVKNPPSTEDKDSFEDFVGAKGSDNSHSKDSYGEIGEVLDEKSDIRLQINSYLDHYIMNHEPFPENRLKRYFRLTVKAIGPCLIGPIAGIPLWAPARNSVGNTLVLSQLIAGGTYITMGTAGAWITIRLLDPLEPISPEERFLRKPARCTYFRQIFSAGAAIVTSIPDTYVAYKYNISSPWVVIPAFIFSFISKQLGYYEFTSMVPSICTNGFYFSKCCKSSSKDVPEGSDLSSSENLYFAQLVNREVTTKVLDSETNNPAELKEFARQYVSTLMQKENAREEFTLMADSIKKAVYLKRILQGFSLILPVANAIVNSLNSYEALGLIYTSALFQVIGAFLITLPTFSLDSAFTMDAFGEIFDNFYARQLGISQRHYMETYFPKTYKYTIPSMSFVLSLCLAITSGYIVYDTLNNSPFHILKYVLAPLVSVANTVLGTYPAMHVYNTLGKGIISLVGKAKDKTLISIDYHMKKMTDFIGTYLFSEN